ncbi:OLC1v1006329C2 [Oldenlandia corymbosa var. corymbosa]|nr:OLC1v1006329C2 [Oldenlandia corymbosa var. corymbosa]
MTFSILEAALASKDVKSAAEIRSALKEFLRRETLAIIRETSEKSFDHKLLIFDFFVRAFALIGDVENWLALRYEAFLMRDENASYDVSLGVSVDEWLAFAEQSLDNGFYSVATKACDKALLCIHGNNLVDSEYEDFHHESTIEKIKRMKDYSMILASSKSVQVQASNYLKKKNVEQPKEQNSVKSQTRTSGSTLFRNGIKARNLRKLQELQCLQTVPL